MVDKRSFWEVIQVLPLAEKALRNCPNLSFLDVGHCAVLRLGRGREGLQKCVAKSWSCWIFKVVNWWSRDWHIPSLRRPGGFDSWDDLGGRDGCYL